MTEAYYIKLNTPQRQTIEGFKTGLFNCFLNTPLCLSEFVLPICTSLYITYNNFQILEGDQQAFKHCCLAACFPICLYPIYRGEKRENLQIQGSWGQDCCVHCFCHCCAILQEDREMKMSMKQTSDAIKDKVY